MSFWDIVWFIFITWAFRDRELSGWGKAAWCLALLVVPFITALVYLGVRGGDMAERSADAAARQQHQQDAYIREVAGTRTPADQIAQAQALLDAGSISKPEFDALKTKALAPV